MAQIPYNTQASVLTTNGGQQSALNLAAGANLVKATAGRIFSLNVNTAGTAGTLAVYDSATTAGAAAANLVWEGSATTAQGTVIVLNFPCANGIVVTAPTGGVVAVSYV